MKRFWNSRKDDRPYFSYAFILLVSVLAIVLGTYESFTEMMASESEWKIIKINRIFTKDYFNILLDSKVTLLYVFYNYYINMI